MADNVTFQSTTPATPPESTVVATDDVSGVQFQRIKVDVGADGASSPLVRGQQNRAGSLPTALSTEDAQALADILAKLSSDPASQTTLAAILAKLISNPATEAKQDTTNTKLDSLISQTDGIEGSLSSIDSKLPASPATSGKQDIGNTSLASIDGKVSDVATQTTSAAILAKLSSDPATSTKQDTGNTSLASIITLLTTQAGYLDGVEGLLGRLPSGGAASESTLASILQEGTAITGQSLEAGGAHGLGWLSSVRKAITDMAAKLPTLVSGRLPVDGSGVTQPVSAASLPLPTNAATESTLATLPTAGTVITGQSLESGGAGALGWWSSMRKAISDLAAKLPSALVSGRLDVNIGASTTVPVSGTFWQATQPVSAASLPLPSGAATSANQTTANTSLASIDSKLTGPITTTEASATLYAGTATLSTSAAAIAASQAVQEVIVQSDPDNTVDIFVGNVSAQPIQLKPGAAFVLPVTNLATVYAKSASGSPTLNYLGRS